MNSEPKRWPRPRRRDGLGDVVASVAEPIAAIVDRLTGSHISGCSGCQKRRDTLNRIVPFKPSVESQMPLDKSETTQ